MKKEKIRSIISGFLAGVTIATSVLSPMTTFAAEPPVEDKPPLYEEVKDLIKTDEVVTASDIEINVGDKFNVKEDFKGIEIPDKKKVKVTFHNATDDKGNDFSTDVSGKYNAVYYVDPVSDSPTYQISRNITVKEKEKTKEETKEIPVKDIIDQASEQTDLLALEEGESVVVEVVSPIAMYSARAASTYVTITSGPKYYYNTYGMGNYVTSLFYISYGDVSATAYCVQPEKPDPGSGSYELVPVSGNRDLAKVCYYGTPSLSGGEGFFASHYSDFPEGKKVIITHLAASYAYDNGIPFYGANDTAISLAKELYNFAVNQTEIPYTEMSFSKSHLKAVKYGDDSQKTEEITFNAHRDQSITMKLPKGVKLVDVTHEKTYYPGDTVTIWGNTTFYFVAPLSQAGDVSLKFSETFRGNLQDDYVAYSLTTGSTVQDLAFVFADTVENTAQASIDIEWLKEAEVELHKTDSRENSDVEGAIYGVYSDKECKNLITKMPATDKNGCTSVKLEKTQDTVYIKEISVPKPYVIDEKVYPVSLLIGKKVKVETADKEQLGKLSIYKEGEELVSADISDEGVIFNYEEHKLIGAKFNVYANEDITNATGKKIYSKGDLVAKNLMTDSSGVVSLDKLYLGSYKVKEVGAPDNYVNTEEEKVVTLAYGGQEVETVFTETTFKNNRQKAEVNVLKQDNLTKKPLDGGQYSLYAGTDIYDCTGKAIVTKGTLIETVTTNEEGKAKFKSDLPIDASYYVTETKAPAMYRRNSKDRFGFEFKFTNDKEAVQTFTHTFENERVDAKIDLIKKDKETGIAQGDATLEGAVYGLYAREDIVHPDGETGVIYKKDTKIAELTTDKNGKAGIKDLYLGKYYIKEIKAPVGYVLDENEYDLDIADEGDLTATVEKQVVSLETVKKQPFQIIKAADNGKTDADLLKSVGFTAYLESSLKVNKDGSYDFKSAKPVVIGENGATEIFTDENGHALSIPLAYGTYIVRETTTPHNYKPVEDFVVKITENSPNKPQVWRVLLDKEFEAKLKITKKDDETNKSVLLKDTAFKIFNMDTKKYVEQVTTYPTVVKHKVFYTNEEGYLILPEALKIGHYRVEEVEAPNGYTLNENYFEIHVDSNTAHQMEETSKDIIISVDYENHPVKGELTIYKTGEVLDGFKNGKFVYKEQKLEGAEFEILAAEDIYTPDHQVDENGSRITIYKKGQVVTTVTTDKDGKAIVNNLPLGKYMAKEVHAPGGFVLNTKPQTVEFTYKDQKTPVVKEELSFENDRQKVEIKVVKKDEETEKVLEGAEFTLCTAEDIKVDDKVIVKADTELETVVTGEDGLAKFTMNIPFAKYYVKETKAPDGYVSSDEILEFETSYQGENVKVAKYEQVKTNKPTVFEFTKIDITSGEELDGAELSVIDKDGNVIDNWVSEKGKAHVIKYLKVGEIYTLREELAPYGYLKATDVKFTVEDTAEIQRVEMEDDVPVGEIIINKEGEFLDKITLLDTVKGIIEHFFEYVFGKLTPVTFEIYARVDIKAADGVTSDYFKAGDLVDTITTDSKGIATSKKLPLGKYYVVEKETAEGYVLDEKPRDIDLLYVNQDTPVITYEESWQNERQKVEVTVTKKEKDTDEVLEGGIFALYTAEEIKSVSGEVLMKADTIIEQKVTDSEGKIVFKAELPVGGKYYVKEVKAPEGYVTSFEQHEFIFEYEGPEKEKVQFEFTFENEPTKTLISKMDITGDSELPGAKLSILDKDDKVIKSWVSTNEPHYIEKLPEGEYTLREDAAPKGYIISNDVKFEIKDTAEIQKVAMTDDTAKGKVIINKKDETSGKPLKGVEFELRDAEANVLETLVTDEAGHAESKLYAIASFKDGVYDTAINYTLVETKTLDGYILDKTEHKVVFEYKDDNTPVIEVKFDLSNKKEEVPKVPETPKKSDSPKTGDTSNVLGFAGIAGASLAVLIATIAKKKRK